jgi:hypothetical protein
MFREDGTLHAFEVTSSWTTFRPLYAILESIPGVTDVRRQLYKDDRIAFLYHGVPFVVHEPFGDTSRYLIGPNDVAGLSGNIEPIHDAFRRYRGPILRIWDRVTRRANV